MKKQVSLLICLLLAALSTLAQTDRRNVLKTNLLSPIIRVAHLNYERGLSSSLSIQVGSMYLFGIRQESTSFNGFAITPELRYYASDNATQGFFVAISPRYQSYRLKAETTDDNGNPVQAKATLNTMGGALIVGNQWHFSKGITFELYGGPSYNGSQIKVDSGNPDDFTTTNFSGFGLRFGLMLGVAF